MRDSGIISLQDLMQEYSDQVKPEAYLELRQTPVMV